MWKKALVFLPVAVGLIALSALGLPIAGDLQGDYTVYTREADGNLTGRILHSADPLGAALLRLSDPAPQGESVRFQGDRAAAEAMLSQLQATVVKESEINGLTVIYARSARLRGGVVLNGETVNLQIALRGKTVTAGTPLILGSY